MAEVTLNIGGRQYDLNCRDGEEAHLRLLASLVDEKTNMARRATPGLTEIRQLLFAGIFMADELHDLRNQANAAPQSGLSDEQMASLRAEIEQEIRAEIAAEAEKRAAAEAEAEAAMTQHLNLLSSRIETITDRLAANSISA